MQFAQRLKQEMDKRKLTQYRLAKLIGCSQSSVGNWLKGKRVPVGVMKGKLLEVLGLNEEDLFPTKSNVEGFIPIAGKDDLKWFDDISTQYGISLDPKRVKISEGMAMIATLLAIRDNGEGDSK